MYANFITDYNISDLRESSRVAQVPLAGHMHPAARVFETAVVDIEQV